MAKFVHLHGHSEYSLLDGLSKIPQLVKKTKELGMEALALTDHGTMYGAIEFYKSCKDAGVKPIIGCEVYVAPRSHKLKEGKIDTEPYHLILLAKNYRGYQNLMKLVSISFLDGFYYKPRVDKELLRQFSEGLICLSACPAGELIRSIEKQDLKQTQKVAEEYRDIFGEGNYFFELQSHPYAQILGQVSEELIRRDLEHLAKLQELSFAAIKELSPKMGIELVSTNDFHYIEKADAQVQDALICIQTGKLLSDINRLRMIDTPDYYLKSPQEMEENFKDLPQALKTSVKIAEMIDLEIPMGKSHFPIFKAPENRLSMDYLRELTFQGAKQKLSLTQEDKDRLEYELGVIEHKNYADYFLVVADFINWAHSQGIITNTRGSAAGSLVLYCLGVTNLNPLDYTLPFERFLTKDRPSLPDIDADLADDRRDDVIRYVMHKYGEDRVAHIVTFGTMMGRAAIRDIGRVMGMDYGEVDRIAKLVPPPHQGFHKPLADAIREVPDLYELYKSNPEVKRLLDLAKKIEGTVRHASVHAAGIVISPDEITNFAPLQKEANGDKVVCMYDMFAIEDAGLVKMDFLGIRNLSILGRAIEFVKQNRQLEIDLDQIPLDDKKAYQLLAKGETMGVFQLSSSGMTKYLMDLKPTSIADLAAMVALYRPGPLSVIPDYIARKNNPKLIKYYDPRMESYMHQSLGLLVYQEDVLFTAINIAGYSWEEADKFRKAMGKKIPSEMEKQRGHFVEGCVKNGMVEEKAVDLFNLIAPFAAYGFNKCLTGDTFVQDDLTKERFRIKDLYKSSKKVSLLSLEKDKSLKARPVTNICENGVKPVFELITKKGFKIRTTDNHPFLTPTGWVDLGELKTGNKVGTLLDSDLYWDEIVNIETKGEEMTYDLTIQETHNFVANDILVHNSHAASYGMVAYHTAYMKANFPVEFMAAVMTAEYGDIDKIAQAIEECRKMFIPVLHPDVNRSGIGFTIEELSSEDLASQIKEQKGKDYFTQGIRFGLSAIKNVGISAIESIIKARSLKPFVSLMDICSRVDTRLVNRKTLESLIKAGALDGLGSRSSQLMVLDDCLEESHKNNRASLGGQASLFGDDDQIFSKKFELPQVDELTLEQLLIFEKDLLGFYLHEPPYLKNLEKLKEYITTKIADLGDSNIGTRVIIGGVLQEIKKVLTKKNASEMAFLKVFDGTSEIECVVFPKTYATLKSSLLKEQVVLLWGKFDKREDKFSVLVDNVEKFDPNNIPIVEVESNLASGVRMIKKASEGALEIELPKAADSQLLKKVNQLLRQFPGSSPITILIPAGNTMRKIDLNIKVKKDQELITSVESLLGQGSVRLI